MQAITTMPTDTPVQNWAIVLLFVVVATFMMLIMIRRARRPTVSGREQARQQMSRLRDEAEIRSSMDKLLIRLEEYSRDVNGQLDTKFVRLEQVIQDADDRISRLRSVIDEHDKRLGRLVETSRRLRTRSEPDAEKAPDSPAVAPSGDANPRDPRYKNVYDLADAGSSPVDIAERLGMPAGEIELILNLRSAG